LCIFKKSNPQNPKFDYGWLLINLIEKTQKRLFAVAKYFKIRVMTQAQKLLKEYLDYLEIEKNRSPKTRENYERYLQKFFQIAKISKVEDITDTAVRDFRLQLARTALKKVTQTYYIIALRNFLKYLIQRDYRVLSPEKIELPRVARNDIEILDYNEIERLLASPKEKNLRALRDRAVLETLFSTGLRLSELCSLNRNIDLERGELSVRGKGGKLRVVFLSAPAKAAIKTYLNNRTDINEALFVSLDKRGKALGRITPRAVQRLITARAKSAGIAKRVHPHQIRHAYATDLLINGADLRSVQALLGHASVTTTQIYTHLTNKELKEIHEAFHRRRRR